ncbi:MAG TPA: Asp-tRNA(Asn)/Glu-tRNA(Gln) amidotransferase subunit GatA [Anaerolineae bacterium]|nr:Asp-tRNA(Asn)/Glu-tRNA(Gln) amidotransferase subunit GatA [Caldilineae bacterium]HID34385.1 Asp-tRNA(Asn)/Glu-tRNA(Gln) amidotransferase subunit GatA [Anaerolineae bacterium]HIQ11667.1 Asp-tRNA(Asn)/Glu-tRNA(Gln) amidotransferase subunit GatA [Caldilineales bacterium]
MSALPQTIHQARAWLRSGQITSVELTEAYLERIHHRDDAIHAFLHVAEDHALAQARLADERRAAGEDAPLLGVPLAIKDVIAVQGMPATAASRILEGFMPPYEATVIRKLREGGAVILGKVNTDEFAMGWSTENSAYGVTHNPWALDHVPGGSSGGPAAAVAAGEAIAALGTDTGGSVRQPASWTNTVGMRPTYGRVSRYGVIAFASSLDQVGPITRDVSDNAILLEAIAGHDPRDSTTFPDPVPPFSQMLDGGVKGMRLGLPREYLTEDMHPGVREATQEGVRVLRDLGATVEEASLPHTDYGMPVYYLIVTAEASANLARYDGVRYGYSAGAADLQENYRLTRGRGFGPEVKRRILLGAYALSAGYYDAYYLKAQKVRTLIRADFDDAFQRFDALIAPVAPIPPFRIGEAPTDPVALYLLDALTLPSALAGVPAIAVPAGFVEEDGAQLPVGVQFIGRPLDEATLFRIAYAFERATRFGERTLTVA